MNQNTGSLRCALHEPLDRAVLCRGVCVGSKRQLSPACGRRGPFQGGEGRKRLAPGRTSVRLLPHRFPALLAECGPAPTRASLPSVAARPRSLCSLRLHFAATRLARSNSGALLPHSAAMLGVLYGALSHLARASLRYRSAFPFHPTASWCYDNVSWIFWRFPSRFLRPLRIKRLTLRLRGSWSVCSSRHLNRSLAMTI